MKKTAIAVTTIFQPEFLSGYIDNITQYGHSDYVDLIVIIDKKTPVIVYEQCNVLRRKGFSIICPSLEEQEAFINKFPSMTDRIPYDSDNRRNIGFMIALDRGADVLISIDDDNYCLDDLDFVGEHSVVGSSVKGMVVDSSDMWFNLGAMLESQVKDEVFPRGFPYYARNKSRRINRFEQGNCTIAMNAGLWLSDPDIDAISRLTFAPRISRVQQGSILLSSTTWSPINTQNTALKREAVAAYYYVKMGFPVGGMNIDRYGDILSGYFCQKCVKSLGEYVRIGSPVADHRRTPHNLFKDLHQELAGMVIIEELLPWLMELKLEGRSYPDAYAALADALEDQASRFKGFVWDQGGREFLVETANNMRAWHKCVKDIGL